MYSRFQVPKTNILPFFDAFKTLPDVPRTVFARHGLCTVGADGEIEVVDVAPLEKLITAMNELCNLVGPQRVFEIGLNIVERAALPQGVTDIVSAMKSMDMGYHMNHMVDGRPMLDLETGTMLEGIGHYQCTYASKHRVMMEVDVPYNCDMDRGIMQGWARKFEPSALVTHIEPSVCRKNRAPRCRYEVSWK